MKLMGISIMGWFFTIVVSIILLVWVQILWSEVGILVTGTRAKGVVVEVLDEGDLFRIVVEFTTAKGEKIIYKGRNGNAIPTATLGQVVRVIYKESNPHFARIMLWGESGIWSVIIIFWFLFVFSYIWLGLIKMSGDESVGDPFHLLPKCVWLFPFVTIRITAYVVFAFGLLGFGYIGYVFAVEGYEFRTKGIKVTGIVTGFESNRTVTNTINGSSTFSEDYAFITYADTSGEYTMSKSILRPLSHIKIGDTREVIYLSRKPSAGVENTWMALWFPTFFFSAVVILFITLIVMLHNRPDLWPAYTEKELFILHENWKKEPPKD